MQLLPLLLTALPVTSLSLTPVPQDPPAESEEPSPSAPSKPSNREEALAGDSYVVTPGRRREEAFDSPYTVDTVNQKDIERRAQRSLPEALRFVPGVLLQKTTHGQGSPFIRGFTAQRNLLLIDGIRLNNSVLRPGPNQYWSTVDSASLERLEVVKGPSSVLYGSDAIGGTVQAITKRPYGEGLGGALEWRVKDGENSHFARGEWSGWFGDTGFLLGLTRKDLGDFEGGADFGTFRNTGFDEWDADAKVETYLADNVRMVFAHQRVEQNDVPRTHSTQFAQSFAGSTVGSDQRRDLHQDRDLSYVQIHADNLDGLFDSLVTSFSYHRQSELEDRIRSSGSRTRQGFDVRTTGFFTHAVSETDYGTWTVGADLYHDDVDSFRDRGADQTEADNIQGAVADDATYDKLGVFAQNTFEINKRLEMTLGVRFDYAAADADSVRDPVTSQATTIDDSWDQIVGSARFNYDLTKEADWRLFGGVSQGFRAPNLSDLTRFDAARSNEFEIPSPDLDPERYISYELGVRTQNEEWAAEASIFYTDIQDSIVRFPTGNTNAEGDFEITKANAADGEVFGFELGGTWLFRPGWSAFANMAWIDGEISGFPDSSQESSEDSVSRLLPLTVHTGVRWEDPEEGIWVEGLASLAEEQDNLSARDEGDTQRIPPGGTPSYAVFSVFGGFDVADGIELTLGVENIFDEDYRVHGSGTNMPGRSFLVGVRASF